MARYNSNQRYATSARTAALMKALAAKAETPIQEFMVRNDSPCGSTIGPIVAAKLGVMTVDVGLPQLSMHSIREMAGTRDVDLGIRLLKVHFARGHLHTVYIRPSTRCPPSPLVAHNYEMPSLAIGST